MVKRASKHNQTELWDSWTALTTGLETSGYTPLSPPH